MTEQVGEISLRSMLVTTNALPPVFLVGTMAAEMRRSLHFRSAALGAAVAFYYLPGRCCQLCPGESSGRACGGSQGHAGGRPRYGHALGALGRRDEPGREFRERPARE